MTQGLDLTTEELFALCAAFDLDEPEFLRQSPASKWSDEVRNEVIALGLRSLSTKGIIRHEDGETRVATNLRPVMAALSDPASVISVAYHSSAVTRAVMIHAADDQLALVQRTAFGNYRLDVAPAGNASIILDQTMDLTDGDSPIDLTESVTIDLEAFSEQVRQALENGESADLAESLSDPLQDLGISTDVVTRNVTVLHRREEALVEGSTATWITDGGRRWELTYEGDKNAITLQPVAASALRDRMLSSLSG